MYYAWPDESKSPMHSGSLEELLASSAQSQLLNFTAPSSRFLRDAPAARRTPAHRADLPILPDGDATAARRQWAEDDGPARRESGAHGRGGGAWGTLSASAGSRGRCAFQSAKRRLGPTRPLLKPVQPEFDRPAET